VYGKKEGESQQPNPNLRLWSLPDGQLLATLAAQRQQSWQPQWTDDEVHCGRLMGSELLFHKGGVYGSSILSSMRTFSHKTIISLVKYTIHIQYRNVCNAIVHHCAISDKYDSKLVIQKMVDYAVSKGPAPQHVACYVPPSKVEKAADGTIKSFLKTCRFRDSPPLFMYVKSIPTSHRLPTKPFGSATASNSIGTARVSTLFR
jgi:uncharacterized protein with WD repeat